MRSVKKVSDPELEFSPFSGSFTRGGVTVEVRIFRFARTDDEWTLEVVDREGTSTVWNDLFSDDHDAYEAFMRAVAEDGMGTFSDDGSARH